MCTQLALLAGSRAEQYKQGVEHELKKVATDVTNWRLMHRMLAENIPLALIMEDDFLLPEGREVQSLPNLSWHLYLFAGSSRGRPVTLG